MKFLLAGVVVMLTLIAMFTAAIRLNEPKPCQDTQSVTACYGDHTPGTKTD